jgi:hypothetical protein
MTHNVVPKHLLDRYGFDTNERVITTIRSAFPRWFEDKHNKPQAFMLAKALELLHIHLSTQDIDKMIDWAYQKEWEVVKEWTEK